MNQYEMCKNKILESKPYGGTSYNTALESLFDVLSKNDKKAKPYCIFLSDGQPTDVKTI